VQKQLKAVFGYFWQIHGVHLVSVLFWMSLLLLNFVIEKHMTADDVSGGQNACYQNSGAYLSTIEFL